jgi:hypothetical protein
MNADNLTEMSVTEQFLITDCHHFGSRDSTDSETRSDVGTGAR